MSGFSRSPERLRCSADAEFLFRSSRSSERLCCPAEAEFLFRVFCFLCDFPLNP